MAQRQFRSDDTNPWPFGFGSARLGDLVIGSNTTLAPAVASCSGTAGLYALTLGTASTFVNQYLIKIVQIRGTLPTQNWEYNIIISGAGTTALTLGLPLMNTYTTSGSNAAYCMEMREYHDVTINVGSTLTIAAWNGVTGGDLSFFYTGTLTSNGIVDLDGKGYQGSANSGNANGGNSGEGHTGAANVVSGSQVGGAVVGNGAGGGRGTLGGDVPASSGAGAGGHSSTGGSGTNGNNGGSGAGTGGGTSGATDGTQLTFGGAGGQGGNRGTFASATMGHGGGMFCPVGPYLTGTGTIRMRGNTPETPANGDAGGNGGGAGGFYHGKHILPDFTSITFQFGGGSGTIPGGNGGRAGDGSSGRANCDYLDHVIAAPAGLNTRFEPGLGAAVGAGLAFF